MDITNPKNRIDLILEDAIRTDIKNLDYLKSLYRGLERYREFETHIDKAIYLLKEVSWKDAYEEHVNIIK